MTYAQAKVFSQRRKSRKGVLLPITIGILSIYAKRKKHFYESPKEIKKMHRKLNHHPYCFSPGRNSSPAWGWSPSPSVYPFSPPVYLFSPPVYSSSLTKRIKHTAEMLIPMPKTLKSFKILNIPIINSENYGEDIGGYVEDIKDYDEARGGYGKDTDDYDEDMGDYGEDI